jgi:hypothetical protein
MYEKHKPFHMNFYLKFAYVPETEMAKYYPNTEYFAGFRTAADARNHLEEAKERDDVIYEQRVYSKKELNEA